MSDIFKLTSSFCVVFMRYSIHSFEGNVLVHMFRDLLLLLSLQTGPEIWITGIHRVILTQMEASVKQVGIVVDVIFAVLGAIKAVFYQDLTSEDSEIVAEIFDGAEVFRTLWFCSNLIDLLRAVKPVTELIFAVRAGCFRTLTRVQRDELC